MTKRFRSWQTGTVSGWRAVLLGVAGVLLAWVLAQALAGPSGCPARLENGIRSAWDEAWQRVEREVGGGAAPSARSLRRSSQGYRVAMTIENLARDVFGGAELIEPSATQARTWWAEYLTIHDAVRAAGGPSSGLPPGELEIEDLGSSESLAHLRMRARGGGIVLEIEVLADCENGRLRQVRVR